MKAWIRVTNGRQEAEKQLSSEGWFEVKKVLRFLHLNELRDGEHLTDSAALFKTAGEELATENALNSYKCDLKTFLTSWQEATENALN